MTGEWKVSEGEIRYHNPPSNSYYENYKADKISINYSDEYYNYIGDGTYYWNFSINKNGKYTITKFINVIYYLLPFLLFFHFCFNLLQKFLLCHRISSKYKQFITIFMK